MIPESVRQQLRAGEGESAEFIQDAQDFAKVARSICAFLNGHGGSLFVGVDEHGNLTGVRLDRQVSETIHQHLREVISPFASMLSVAMYEEKGKSLVVVDVPAGQDKPYLYHGAVFVRVGSATIAADSATLRRMVQEAAVKTERWERRPSVALEETDLDEDDIRLTAKQAEEAGRFRFSDTKSVDSVLTGLGLLRDGQYTQAADVLFAKDPALRHPQVRVRATFFAEDKDSSDYLDSKVFDSRLLYSLQETVHFVQRNTQNLVTFRRGGLRTADHPAYPLEAVREGLVNAFAHRDYSSFSGGMAVRIYPSRLEVWNSGHLPEGITTGDLKRNHPSIPVNPDIANVLYIRGYMEMIGRGTQNIVNVCRAHGLRSPSWEDRPNGVTLTLYGKTRFPADRTPFNKRQDAVLSTLTSGEELSPGAYRKRFARDVSERQARRDLRELEEANLLERVGSGAGTRYRRTDRGLGRRNRT
jgi:ATP-dependent DNA helicase RecG